MADFWPCETHKLFQKTSQQWETWERLSDCVIAHKTYKTRYSYVSVTMYLVYIA